jgi:preprotein translocase subunit YajC
MKHVAVIAQQTGPAEGPGGQGSGKPGGMPLDVMLIWLVPIALIFFLMYRSQKKKDSERKEMLGRLKKGDRVVSIGGIHGEIVKINEKEVTLLVDKSKNVELRFQRTAIHGTLGADDEAKGSGDKGTQEGGTKA